MSQGILESSPAAPLQDTPDLGRGQWQAQVMQHTFAMNEIYRFSSERQLLRRAHNRGHPLTDRAITGQLANVTGCFQRDIAGDDMLGSLVRSAGRPLGRHPYDTTLWFIHQVKRRGNTGSPSAYAQLPRPCVEALLTLAQGYSMVRHSIPNAWRLLPFLHIDISTFRYS